MAIFQPPQDFYAPQHLADAFSYWAGGFAVLALPYCIYRGVKTKEWAPLLLWIGGFIACLNEATIEFNLNMTEPQNYPGIYYQAFGIRIPLFMPFCYAFFVSMFGYLVYRLMARERGLTVKGFFYVFCAIALAETCMELPGTYLGAYKYLGEQPFRVLGFPLWQAWTNATGFVLIGFICWLFAPMLTGRKAALFLLIPVFGFHGGWGMVAWPNYIAMNLELPFVVPLWGRNLLSAFSFGISLVVVWGVAAVAAVDSKWAGKLQFDKRVRGIRDRVAEPARVIANGGTEGARGTAC